MANTTDFRNSSDLELTTKINILEDDSDKSMNSDQIVSILYIVIGVIGTLGNAFVIFVIYKYTKIYKRLSNIYVINQSLIDMVVAIFLVLTTIFQDTGEPLQGIGGEIKCKLWYTKTLLWSPFISSTYNLIILTIDRYFEIVHPWTHKRLFGKSIAYVSIAIAWLFGYVFNFSYVFAISGLIGNVCIPYGKWPSKMSQNIMGVVIFGIHFFIPLCVMAFCYTKMALIIQRQLKMRVQPEESNNQSSSNFVDRKMVKARTNIIKTFGIVSISFILCWSCNQVYYFLFNLGYSVNFTNTFYHISVIAVFINCCINPFIYAFKFGEFQAGLRKMFKLKNSSESSDVSSVVHS